MADHFTSRMALRYPDYRDRRWDQDMDETIAKLEGANPIGALAVTVTATERSAGSSTRRVDVAAGAYRKADGTLGSYAGVAAYTLSADGTWRLYLDSAGALQADSIGYPGGGGGAPSAAFHTRLATVTAAGGFVAGIVDDRVATGESGVNLNTVYLALAGGTFADGSGVVVVEPGTTNGVKLGAGTTSKLGLWGAAPIAQRASANQVALTDSTGGTPGTTLATISDAATADAVASLARLLNQLRADLVAIGAIKGSA
jgi:hypothetical protein